MSAVRGVVQLTVLLGLVMSELQTRVGCVGGKVCEGLSHYGDEGVAWYVLALIMADEEERLEDEQMDEVDDEGDGEREENEKEQRGAREHSGAAGEAISIYVDKASSRLTMGYARGRVSVRPSSR